MPDTPVSTIIDLDRTCPTCVGEGVVGGLVIGDNVVDERCGRCAGTGTDPAVDIEPIHGCGPCGGSGIVRGSEHFERCPWCEGRGLA